MPIWKVADFCLALLIICLLPGCTGPLSSGLTEKSKGIKVGMTAEEVDLVLDPNSILESEQGPLGSRVHKRRWEVVRSGGGEINDKGESNYTGIMTWRGRPKDNEKGVNLTVTFVDGKVTEKKVEKVNAAP